MPIFEIQGPDGRTYEIDAPDQNAALSAFRSFAMPDQPAETPPAQQEPARAAMGTDAPWYQDLGNAASDILRIGSNAVTFGARDKFAPAITGRSVEEERAMTDQARERAGGAGFATEIMGGAALPMAAANAGYTAMNAVPAALSGAKGLLARSGAMAADGSLVGAATAAGNDQGILGGMGMGAVGGLLGNLLGEGVSSVFSRGAKAPPVMDADQLRGAKNAAYKAVDDIGVTYRPEAFDDLVRGMTDEVKAANISPMRHPKASSMMMEIHELRGSSPTLTQLDQLRQVIRRDVANSTDDAEAFFGRKMIKNIDEFIAAAGPKQVSAGNADDAARAVRTARDLNTRLVKTENVTDAVESARLRAASTGSGGNVDNATRQNLRRVLENGNWSPDERAALLKAVEGTKGQDLLRLVGKLSPQGNGLMAALGIGGTMANPVLGIPALAGVGAKAAADRATQRNVQDVLRVIGSGGSRSMPANGANSLAKTEREALSRLLGLIGAQQAAMP